MGQQVLIFDSGVGGLTIYDSVRSISPQASYTYLFDNQCFPYGELEEGVLIERVLLVIEKAIEQSLPDIIIIACNSASTLALPKLRQRFSIPIVGVVPAIKPASEQTQNGIIGLLATPGTVMRSYTKALIDDFAADKEVLLIGHSALVELAESKMSGEVVDIKKLELILAQWKTESKQPDTIVLGCTHFPIIKDEIAQVLARPVTFVDSGAAIGRRVKSILNKSHGERLGLQKSRVYCTRLDEKAVALQASFSRYHFSEILCLSV